ncbi:MAG: Do family serine endopeptidase [Alphaproteobacteria bacterium]|nr:Do family serine endopeptidase [Alphaproteobacteria bacterium]
MTHTARNWNVALGAGLLALVLLAVPAAAQPRGPASVSALALETTPTVVNISTSRRVGGGGTDVPFPRAPEGSPLEDLLDRFEPDSPGRRVSSLGSGFVIDTSGLIATNNHVIADADEIFVFFPDGERVEAELVGADARTDLAVLRITTDRPLKAVRFGDSDTAEVGDWVMAVGNPFGLGGSVSLGIVSARNRDIQSGPYDNFIQTDAAINQGNSGGPLFDMNGDVVGINTAIIASGGNSLGVGFAIPINLARPVLDQLVEFGETRRGWLGVGIQDVTRDIAASLDLDGTAGALVLSITPDSPSDGKLAEGDIILEFDGREIARMRDLPRIVAETAVGSAIDVLVYREGENLLVNITLGRLEQEQAPVAPEPVETVPPEPEISVEPGVLLGLSVSPPTAELREEYALSEDSPGIVIVDVDPRSDAFDKGLRPGLSVLEVNQMPVNSLQDFSRLVDDAVDAGREAILVRLSDPAGNRRYVALRLGPR